MSRSHRRASPNHRAMRTALSAALALFLILIAGAAAAQSCPGNFFDTLESKTDTTAAKQNIANYATLPGTRTNTSSWNDRYHARSARRGHVARIAAASAVRVRQRIPVETRRS